MPTKPKKGLGKGLESLIPTNFDTVILMDADERIQNLFINDITPNPDQPRRHFDAAALDQLAASIEQYGVIQPIVVSPIENNKYIIVAGERRWRAATIAGMDTIPAIVKNRQELNQLEVALIENVQRVDLSPIEQAISIERLHQQFNIPYSDIAKRLSKAETTVSNIVRLLQLPPIVRDALQIGEISEGHARAILSIKDYPDHQLELLQLIVKNDWSVRQAEHYASVVKTGTNKNVSKKVVSETPETKQLSKILNTKVAVKHTAKGGRLEIFFKDELQLQKIIKKIS